MEDFRPDAGEEDPNFTLGEKEEVEARVTAELLQEEEDVKDVPMEPEGTAEDWAADREEAKSIMIRRQMMYLNELNAKFEEEDKGDPRGERIVNE